jgi:hypothetical protein
MTLASNAGAAPGGLAFAPLGAATMRSLAARCAAP